jgi:hypothetical protein
MSKNIIMSLDDKIKKYLRIRPHDAPPYCGRMNSNRMDLANILKLANATIGAEIGVNKGDFSVFLFKNVPDLSMLCIDPWDCYYSKRIQRKQNRAHEAAKKQLAPWDAKIVKKTSLDAVKYVPDESLDFIHIDGDHRFDFCMTDHIFWAPKVKIGGIIAGHDYAHHHGFGVIEAINAYTRAHNIIDWYIVKGHMPTYFWVKKENNETNCQL